MILINIGIILTFFISLGKAFDYLTLNTQKSKVYTGVLNKIQKIDSAKQLEIPNLVIEWYLEIFNKYFVLKKNRWRTLLIFTITSWTLTTIFSYTAKYLRISDVSDFNFRLPEIWFYAVNFIFDYLTLFITYKVFTKIKNKPFYQSIPYLMLDITLALVLAVTVWILLLRTVPLPALPMTKTKPGYNKVLGTSLEEWKYKGYFTLLKKSISKEGYSEKAIIKSINYNVPWSQSRFYFKYLQRSLNDKQIIYEGQHYITLSENGKTQTFKLPDKTAIPNDSLIVSLTTLIPTTLFILFLFLSIISKEILAISKIVSLHILKTSTENVSLENIKDFKLGQHLGIILGVFGAFLNMILEFIS